MAYHLDIDPIARAQIKALPAASVRALTAALDVLTLVPERGEPLNAANPEGGPYQLPFDQGHGLLTYLLLSDQDRVDVLVVTWVDFGGA